MYKIWWIYLIQITVIYLYFTICQLFVLLKDQQNFTVNSVFAEQKDLEMDRYLRPEEAV